MTAAVQVTGLAEHAVAQIARVGVGATGQEVVARVVAAAGGLFDGAAGARVALGLGAAREVGAGGRAAVVVAEFGHQVGEVDCVHEGEAAPHAGHTEEEGHDEEGPVFVPRRSIGFVC